MLSARTSMPRLQDLSATLPDLWVPPFVVGIGLLQYDSSTEGTLCTRAYLPNA